MNRSAKLYLGESAKQSQVSDYPTKKLDDFQFHEFERADLELHQQSLQLTL
jgi:hypothetical protein